MGFGDGGETAVPQDALQEQVPLRVKRAGCRLACYNRGVATIMGIHGIGQQFRGGFQLETLWFDALRDGLARTGHRRATEKLTPRDLRVAFFGDLFRPPGALAAQEQPFTATNLRPGPERDLLTALFGMAIARDPSLDAPEDAMGQGRAAVQIMLARSARTPTLARIARRAFIWNLKQANAFLSNFSVKENVLARVHADMDENARFLIGYSSGSVVAYEYLCRYQPAEVELLVTLGSPLGIPNVVFDKLTPSPSNGTGTWTGIVPAWLNVADPDDIVAMRKDLAVLFPGSAGEAVADRLVDNRDEPHAIDRCLNNWETGSALSNVLN